MRVKNKIDPSAHDGQGTRTEPLMTGHGAPASASGRGNEPMNRSERSPILNNNWGAKSLKKLQTTGASASVGANRFVQPTMQQTAQMPPNLGNPRVI